MANNKRVPVNGAEYNTYKALKHAELALNSRNHAEAHAHYDTARKYEKQHIDSLSGAERHAEITRFKSITQKAFKHLEGRMDTLKRGKSELAKGPKSTVDAMREFHATGKMPDYNRPKDFGRRAGYDYKQFSDLSPVQQQQARKNFPGSGHEGYHYPIHPETGAVAAGVTRFKTEAAPQASNAGSVPKAGAKTMAAPQASAHVPEIPAHHKEGALVYINKPGHDDHGLFGRVKGENPLLPGKLGVEVKRPNGQLKNETVYASHNELVPKRDFKKTEEQSDTNVVLLKSKATLKRHKGRKRK